LAMAILSVIRRWLLRGARQVARELDAIVALRGKPLAVVSDNGTELTSTLILRWSQERQVEWHCIAPRKAHRERVRRELQRTPAG
jgi:transposase InsO family protein